MHWRGTEHFGWKKANGHRPPKSRHGISPTEPRLKNDGESLGHNRTPLFGIPLDWTADTVKVLYHTIRNICLGYEGAR